MSIRPCLSKLVDLSEALGSTGKDKRTSAIPNGVEARITCRAKKVECFA